MNLGGVKIDVAEDLFVKEEIGPENEGTVGIEGIVDGIRRRRGREDKLLLDVEELVSHVMDLDGDVPP